LQFDPDNPETYNRLLELTKQNVPEADKAREIFRKMIAEGRESALAHLFLGIDAWQQEKADEARHHWEKAFQMSQGAPLVANNLAWVLATRPPADLNRALDLINAAVAKVPDELRFRGTRGHILARMGKPKEALPELEAAVKAYPNDPDLFRVLAETSDKLGHTKMAEEYRAKAAALAKPPAAAGPADDKKPPAEKVGPGQPGDPKAPAVPKPAEGTPPAPPPDAKKPDPANEKKPGTP
jgi:predicted Zn-dependent protease